MILRIGIILISMSAVGYWSYNFHQQQAQRAELRKDAPRKIELVEKSLYARAMGFENRVNGTTGTYIETAGALRSVQVDKWVFVNSEKEAVGYGRSVVVSWPTTETAEHLRQINADITARDIDLSPYSLSSPITVNDMVDRWKDVLQVLTDYHL